MATDEDHNPILLAVGQALRQWSAVEVGLAGIFAILADIPDPMKAHRIIDAIVSFDARLDVVDALMSEEALTPLELETWKRAAAKLKKQYKKRHELAHFSIVNTISNGKDNIRLSPFLTYGQFLRDELRYLTVPEIDARRKGFGELVAALMWFQAEAGKRRVPRPSNPMPEPPLIVRLKESATQILEERARKLLETPHKQLSDREA